MKSGHWSLARRITGWFALTTAAVVLVVCGLSLSFLEQSVERELAALAVEEIDEMRALFQVSDCTPEAAALIADELAEHHASDLAWRFWDERTGALWGDFGSVDFLRELDPVVGDVERTISLSRTVRWRVERVAPHFLVGCAVDGRAQLAMTRRNEILVLGVATLAGVLAILGGAILGRRVSTLIKRVASQAREVRDPRERVDLDVERAPEEIRLVTEALGEMLDNIRDESERAQLMTSGLAHELRSPIQNLLGEAEVTLLRERTAAHYREVLESHVEELQDLARAVDNLITLCTPGQPLQEGRTESFDLGREARLRLTREAGHGVRVDLECAGDLHYEGDREALMLALGNLVRNAVEWSPEGESVEVRLGGMNGSVEFTVDDGGPGVPADERSRIFEPFYHGTSPSGRRTGYGLGLALTRAAIEAHGGRIDVEASPRGGARFRVKLPRQTPFATPA